MENAGNVYNSSNVRSKSYCGKYLINLGSIELVKLIKGASDSNKIWMLRVLLVHAGWQLINEVFNALKLSNAILREVATSADLACLPPKFIHALHRIDEERERVLTVEMSVVELFDNNKTECLEHLIHALKEETSLNTELENTVVRETFWRASLCQNGMESFVKNFAKHPAITPHYYSLALYLSYKNGGEAKELYKWLLVNANHQALEAVESNRLIF